MFSEKKYQETFENHHGDSINPDFAKWVVDFISSFSNTFWIIVFLVGFLTVSYTHLTLPTTPYV